MRFLARRAASGALLTEAAAAAAAAVAVLLRHVSSAVVAGYPVPGIQLGVGAAAAIGVEQLGYQEEQVVEADLGHRCPDRRSALALAERLALDVRMGYLLVGGGRVRIERHHAIGMRRTQFMPIQPNLETPKLDPLQHDRIGRDAQCVPFEVDLDLIEFPLEGRDVLADFGGRWDV